MFPKRLKLRAIVNGVVEKHYSKDIKELHTIMREYKKQYTPEQVSFKLTNGSIHIIEALPLGMMFSNPQDLKGKILGQGMEDSYYVADKEFKKVIRLIEI